jgi:hypothetical protein
VQLLLRKLTTVRGILSRLVKQVHEYEEQLKALKVTHDGVRRFRVRWPRVPTVRSAVQNVHAEWLASNLMMDKAPSKRTMRRWFDQYIGKGTFTTSRPGPRETWCVRALCFTALAGSSVPCQNSTQHKKKKCYCYSLRPHPRSHHWFAQVFEKQSRARRVPAPQWCDTATLTAVCCVCACVWIACNISTEST